MATIRNILSKATPHYLTIGLNLVAVLVNLITIVLNRSLPYRIGPDVYVRYLWSERTLLLAVLLTLGAMLCALAAHRHFLLGLGLVSLLAIFGTTHCVHSGPNPETWCYNNLRSIAGAKERLTPDAGLTNGAAVTLEQICKYFEGRSGRFQCALHGHYIIGRIGTEPRCSVHGSMNEMEADWQRKMKSQSPGLPHPPQTKSTRHRI